MAQRGKGPATSPSSPERVNSTQRHAEALELRKRGKTFAEIADALGYESPVGAYNAVKSELERIVREPAQEVLNLELTRLDKLLDTLHDRMEVCVKAEDDEGVARYILRSLQIMDRRAKYLGLDTAAREESLYEEIQRLAESTGLDAKEITARAEEIVRGH